MAKYRQTTLDNFVVKVKKQSKTNRRLFPCDEICKFDLDKVLESSTKRFEEKWNFDTIACQPLPGRYEWILLESKE